MVTAFAEGCPGLQRLKVKGVVGDPCPLGPAGISALCMNCRQLRMIDLSEIAGLEDTALAYFHEYHMEVLTRVRVTGQRRPPRPYPLKNPTDLLNSAGAVV